jgi:hypothetical protein
MSDQKQKPAPLPEWQRDAIRAVSNSLLRDIVNDSRRGPSVRSSLASRPGQSSEPERPASGGTVPITAVPGVEWIDRVAEGFAERDRAAAIREKLENELVTGRPIKK